MANDRSQSLINKILPLMGDLAELYRDPDTVELIVNEDGRVWLDTLKESSIDTGLFIPEGARTTIIELMADSMGELANRDRPFVSAIFPESLERFQGQLPPLVLAPTFSIRMPARKVITLDEQVARGTLSPTHAAVLRQALVERRNIIISGATGSGKSTFANSLLAETCLSGDRHVIIQDLPELRTVAKNATILFTRASNPVITAQALLVIALRLRPDRIHIGECRDGMTLRELFKAWNTGHPGGLTTLHADSVEDVLYRAEDLIAEVSTQIPHRQIARTVGLIVQIARTPEGRRVTDMIQNIQYDPTTARYSFDRIAA
jgi:type IV secretion system protein VirB11